jgi:hypothetical protein
MVPSDGPHVCTENLTPIGINPRTVQPVVSLYRLSYPGPQEKSQLIKFNLSSIQKLHWKK